MKDLTILGRPDQRRERVRLREVVENGLRWLPGPVAHRAEIATKESARSRRCFASASQMEQVVVNLATNAALSNPYGRRVRVDIRLGRAEANGCSWKCATTARGSGRKSSNDLRAVLHDPSGGKGNRARPLHLQRHRRRPT